MTWRVSLLALSDDEGQVHDHVGALDEPLDRGAVEHVAAAVLGALPAVGGGVEGPARHADDAPDLARALQRADEGAADLARRAGDRDGEARHQLPAWRCGVGDPVRAQHPDAAVLVEVAEHVEAAPAGRIRAQAGQAGLDRRADRVGVDEHEARLALGADRDADGEREPVGADEGQDGVGVAGAERVEALVPDAAAALGGRVADLGLLVVRRADLVDVRVVEPRLGLEVAAGPDVDALGQHVDVDLLGGAAVLGVRGALHEDHRLDVGEEQRDADVGLRARDRHVDAALVRLVARGQRPDDRLAAPVDRHVVGGGGPLEDIQELCRKRPLHQLSRS